MMDANRLQKLLADRSVSLDEVRAEIAALAPAAAQRLMAGARAARDLLGEQARLRLDELASQLEPGTVLRSPQAPPAAAPTSSASGAAGLTRLRDPAQRPAAETMLRPQASPAQTMLRRQAQPTAAGWVSEPSLSPTATEAAAAVPGPGLLLRRRYRLESLLGQGAMGQVWSARDLLSEEAGEQQSLIAVKLFISDFEHDPKALALMQREASRAQKLAHPNIATVFVFDRDDASGLLFMAMELVDGEPLDELLRARGTPGLGRAGALPLIRGIADGLAYAHSQGIVHCDLKPGNVLVTRARVPKIVDFGIAQAVQMAGADAGAGSADGSLVSGYTPAYASPQALAGQAAHPSDDVFALGLLAYELISGRHPFGREPADIARQRGLKPARLAALRAHEWRALARALAFERPRRYADAGQFRRALQGTPALLKVLAGAVMALVLAAAALGYRSYLALLPAVPFESLPSATRTEIRQALQQGSDALAFVRRTHEYGPLAEAAVRFDHAYALHPRNPEAVRGLDAAAQLAIGWARSAPDRSAALEELQTFRQRTGESHYYEHYAPLDRAIDKLTRAR